MQRNDLALAILTAAAAVVGLQNLPLQANSSTSMAPLEQPPPPPQVGPSSEPSGIISLEVVPFNPSSGDS